MNISTNTPAPISFGSSPAVSPNISTADDASVAAFENLMNAPASTFESRFQNLTPEQQAQVKGDLANFTAANDKAMAAAQNLGEPPQFDLSRLQDPGYVDSYLKDASAYTDRSATAVTALNNAIDEGLKFVNTMNAFDPELARTLPDFGTNLMALMQATGRQPAEIQQVATAFGIPNPTA